MTVTQINWFREQEPTITISGNLKYNVQRKKNCNCINCKIITAGDIVIDHEGEALRAAGLDTE